jgi:hypothetical protein
MSLKDVRKDSIRWGIEFGKMRGNLVLCLKYRYTYKDGRVEDDVVGPLVDVGVGPDKKTMSFVFEFPEKCKWFQLKLPVNGFSSSFNKQWMEDVKHSTVISLAFYPQHLSATSILDGEDRMAINADEILQGFRRLSKWIMKNGVSEIPRTWVFNDMLHEAGFNGSKPIKMGAKIVYVVDFDLKQVEAYIDNGKIHLERFRQEEAAEKESRTRKRKLPKEEKEPEEEEEKDSEPKPKRRKGRAPTSAEKGKAPTSEEKVVIDQD